MQVILTVRPFDEWHASVKETIWVSSHIVRFLSSLTFAALRDDANFRFPLASMLTWQNLGILSLTPGRRAFRRMADAVIWDNPEGLNGKFEDKEAARAIYERYIEEVKRIVPPERLLLFSVKEGWGARHSYDTKWI